MTSELDTAARLLADEIESIKSEVGQGRNAHVLKTLQERGTAQQLVRRQYSGRYPFELLQNANDAAAGEKIPPGDRSVKFILTHAALIVADKGRGFGPDEIEAICGLGRSSKDPKVSIGYKGLGFKSVGEITNHPQVTSGTTAFTFDEDRVRAAIEGLVQSLPADHPLPTYAFPFPLEHADLGPDAELVESVLSEGYATVLRLPFRPDVTEEQVSSDLKATLSPRILVLLEATDRLQVIGSSSDFDVRRTIQEGSEFDEILLDVNDEIEHWIVFRQRVTPSDASMVAALGDAWAGVESANVSVGIRLDSQGRPDADPMSRLFVYFPTQERTGLPLLLHGDFALDLDRRHVSQAPEARPYNVWLAEQLAKLLATIVGPALARLFPGQTDFLSVLSPRATGSDFAADIQQMYRGVMRSSPFVPCVDSSIRVPAESLLLPSDLPDHLPTVLSVFRPEELGRLVLTAAHDEPAVTSFLADLGADVLTAAELLQRFEPPPQERAELVLSWLVDWADAIGVTSLARLLAHVPCVPTTTGEWKTPKSGVFFPRERDASDLPDTLPIFIADIPDTEGLEGLLREAGVQPFRWRELLLGTVIPVLVSEETSPDDRAERLDVLRTYFKTEGGGDQEIRTRAQSVLLAARGIDGASALRPSGELYFSQEWTNHDRLERIYGPFGQVEFLDASPPQGDQDRSTELAFLEWLGVRSRPRLTFARADSTTAYRIANLERHPHSRYGAWWQTWQSTPEFMTASTCREHASSSMQLYTSFGLDRFPQLVESHDRQRLKLLFQELSEGWTSSESFALESEFRCTHGWHIGGLTQQGPSLFAHMLRESEWVAGFFRGDEVLGRPSTLWRPVADIPPNVRRQLNQVDSDLDSAASGSFLHRLGIIDGARPSAHDLVNLLRQAAIDWDELEDRPAPRFTVEMARWAMRRLDEVLESGPGSEDMIDLPLLARREGMHLFTPRPYVAGDPFLAVVWGDELPILDADSGLRRLARALELEDLGKKVKIIPTFGGPLESLTRQVDSQIREAAPFLAAVAYKAAPSREDSIRRLRTLSCLVCEQLSLVHQMDGLEKRQEGELAYLARRTERNVGRTRLVGTLYLVAGADGEVDWYTAGPMLAEFLDVPGQRDAFSLLLRADGAARLDFLRSRHLGQDELRAAAQLLGRPDDADVEWPPRAMEFTEDGRVDGAEDAPVEPGKAVPRSEGPDSEIPVHASEVPVIDDLPEVDLDKVGIRDAAMQPIPPADTAQSEGGRSHSGSTRLIDWETRERLFRLYGHQGERLVYEKERERVERFGADPDAVVWESQRDELAEYDIKSLDEDRQAIYIEVKSTSGSDETAAFDISDAEIRMAMKWRSQYFIYRVVNVKSAAPQIVRFNDPVGRIAAGMGDIHASGARMRLWNQDPTAPEAA